MMAKAACAAPLADVSACGANSALVTDRGQTMFGWLTGSYIGAPQIAPCQSKAHFKIASRLILSLPVALSANSYFKAVMSI
jgi:hypothetical protein